MVHFTQPPLLYSWLLQDVMEEQNLYILHILNWQSCINICGNNDNNNNNNNNNNKICVCTYVRNFKFLV